MVYIFYTKFSEKIRDDLLLTYKSWLPPQLVKKNSSFRFWEDQHRNLLGLLLLIKGLKKFGYSKEVLHKLVYDNYLRPSLKNIPLDFNISHSGDYVACAISKTNRVGIDVEIIQNIDFTGFKSVMSSCEWEIIKNSTTATHTFFEFWTIKESVIKADGRGMSLPLLDIEIFDEHVLCKNDKWYIYKLDFVENACAALATCSDTQIEVEFFNFYKIES